MKNCPKPLTPIIIRSFLGLVGCYRRSVDGFASIASLLNTLTQFLKDRLTSTPVLTLPEGTKDFVVYL